jgi:hypothetical protein
MLKIKRKRLIHCWETRLIDSQIDYTGFIIYNHYRNKIGESHKMLINLSDIYLNNNKFPIVEEKIEPPQLYSHLERIFRVKPDNIKHTSRIYSIPHLTIYIVVLKNRDITYNHENIRFSWRRFIDLYKLNNINDLYENILANDINMHINNKLYAENGLHIHFRLKQLYKYMIGYNNIN